MKVDNILNLSYHISEILYSWETGIDDRFESYSSEIESERKLIIY